MKILGIVTGRTTPQLEYIFGWLYLLEEHTDFRLYWIITL